MVTTEELLKYRVTNKANKTPKSVALLIKPTATLEQTEFAL